MVEGQATEGLLPVTLTLTPSRACCDSHLDYVNIIMNPRRKLAKIIRDELTQSDSVLIPESTLQAFLEVTETDLSLEATLLAYENGWITKRTTDHHWLYERKVS